MTTATARTDRRRTVAVLALLATAITATAGLAGGLRACDAPTPHAAGTVPATPAQARLMAGMRYANYADGRVGFQAVLGSEATGVRLTGWVDWHQPLVYLDSLGTTPGDADGLIQAVPGAMAVRPGRITTVPATGASPTAAVAVDPFPPPPVVPPSDGWRVRPFATAGAASSPLDTLLVLLFAIATTTPDDPALMAATGPRFVGRDKVDGVPVQVLEGPAAPPRSPVTAPSGASPSAGTATPAHASPSPSASRSAPFAAYGGEVTYWLDAAGRMRRLDALVGTNLPVRIDFRRDDHTTPAAIEPLGGPPVRPRPVTASEAALLSHLRMRDRAVRGGGISLLVPATDGTQLTARGWLDWRTPAAYLAVDDLDDPTQDMLVHADRTGVDTRHQAAPPVDIDGTPASPAPTPSVSGTDRPPLPPPSHGWQLTAWQQRGDAQGASDLDILLNEALTLTAAQPDNPADLTQSATWLRTDTISGVPVTVFEIRKPVEASVPAGLGRLRYWVDASGLLRRLEVRTRMGGFGYLDLVPGPVPTLPTPTA